MNADARTILVLSGFMGTGKSTLGARVAAATATRFVDLDATIEAMAGKAIPAIFNDEGEARFRELEQRALRDALAGDGKVVAVGGGTLVDDASRTLAMARAFVVTLTASPHTILSRTVGSARPLLDVADPATQVLALLEKRANAYSECHMAISTDDRTADALTEAIVMAWNGWRVFAER